MHYVNDKRCLQQHHQTTRNSCSKQLLLLTHEAQDDNVLFLKEILKEPIRKSLTDGDAVVARAQLV
jgi:hypothetical protein